jgi:hypothetical protein
VVLPPSPCHAGFLNFYRNEIGANKNRLSSVN